ncbi:NTPase KAP family P-loop domain-containing protein 1-like [Zootoca vivipara]|uniref:NTPase KAP family P-loop domain-containing protein 1-like n=1 Tax=Zootoca vivipara TaxID=8524 RepID=UPI00293BBDC6|nr:NTPase KAP family P-loop domain-containing protein 1-like [Zootoca vivipara]
MFLRDDHKRALPVLWPAANVVLVQMLCFFLYVTERESKRKCGWINGRMCSQLWLALRMIFCYPVSGSKGIKSNSTEKVNSIQYIFIDFDAWEYVGCDHIWAGLVATLLDEIEGNNKFLFSLFRVSGCKAMEKSEKGKFVFKGRRGLVIPIVSGLLILLAAYRNLMEDVFQEIFGFVAITGSLTLISPLILACKNFYFTLKKELLTEMDKKTLSAKLGFMHFVKEEVKIITKFLQFMAFQEGREIRVVLKITNLDKCTQDKVVGVLDAINILLSDKDAPFISILAADPSILVDCIKKEKQNTNGYLYLDRIVSLPFSVPKMTPKDEEANSEEKILIHDLLKNYKYITGDSAQLKRVLNTVLTISKLTPETAGIHREKIKEVIDWVVLANSWPCRLSWILQCEEDNRQQRKLEESQAANPNVRQGNGRRNQQGTQDKKTLLQIYNDHESELADYKGKDNIQSLLELDGDPDIFKSFLVNKERSFTAEKVRYFANLLFNLDYSLKRPFELLRGLKNIRKSEERQQEQAKIVTSL